MTEQEKATAEHRRNMIARLRGIDLTLTLILITQVVWVIHTW